MMKNIATMIGNTRVVKGFTCSAAFVQAWGMTKARQIIWWAPGLLAIAIKNKKERRAMQAEKHTANVIQLKQNSKELKGGAQEMFKKEDRRIANEIIEAAGAVIKSIGPEKALPVILTGLVELGWECCEAADLAESLVAGLCKRLAADLN